MRFAVGAMRLGSAVFAVGSMRLVSGAKNPGSDPGLRF